MKVCLVCLPLLLMQLHVTDGCTLAGNKELKLVTAYTGGSVLLSFSCTDIQTKPETVTWQKYTNGHDWVTISPEIKQYKNRVQLFNDLSPGNLSLLISHLTEDDDGDYRCTIKGGEIRDLRLTVKGCTLDQQSKKLTGTVGQSVLLPCSCYELQAKPHTVTWSFSNIQIFPKDETNCYTHRVQLFNDLSPGNVSLLISHLSLQDKGWYRCHINNNQIKDIHLTVKNVPTKDPNSTPEVHNKTAEAPSGTGNSNSNIIIIVCAAAGVLLLGGVMYRIYRGRRRRKTDDGQTVQRTQNDSDVLYAAINPQTKPNKAEEKDDVTYSTVVHRNTERAENTPVTSGDTTVYTSIKTN